VACSSNLRQLVTSQVTYTTDFKEWLPGSPLTTGFSWLPEASINAGVGYTKTTPPRYDGVAVQHWDWLGPLLSQMGYEGPGASNGNPNDPLRVQRFNWMREQPVGRCQNNNIRVNEWTGGTSGVSEGPMLSYFMTTQFTSTETSTASGHGTNDRRPAIDRRGFRPRLNLVGTPSRKVALYEGSRFVDAGNPANLFPNVDINVPPPGGGTFGGAFSDTGPWLFNNRSLDRKTAPGQTLRAAAASGSVPDVRRFAFRHGPNGRGLAGDVKGNMGFFDGHVDLVSDFEATNPEFWFPSGTIIGARLDSWTDTLAKWTVYRDATSSNRVIVP
jgi:prepilin-type processing-associated H-X9-DG protein